MALWLEWCVYEPRIPRTVVLRQYPQLEEEEGLPQSLQRKHSPDDALISDFQPEEPWDDEFLFFKPLVFDVLLWWPWETNTRVLTLITAAMSLCCVKKHSQVSRGFGHRRLWGGQLLCLPNSSSGDQSSRFSRLSYQIHWACWGQSERQGLGTWEKGKRRRRGQENGPEQKSSGKESWYDPNLL